jgi:SAM-dependent methyltransferase
MEPTRFLPLLRPIRGCPGCGDGILRPLHVFPVNHNKRRVTRQLNLALIGCERCGLAFSHPAPDAEELASYYGADADGWDQRIATASDAVAEQLARRTATHRRHLELIRRYVELPDGTAGNRPRALDLGCGIGGWLDALQQEGWETFGIEPGPRAASIAAARHTLLDAIPADGTFDLVVVHHTLEHLEDPGSTLKQLAGALRPGGTIWISVPNLETLGSHRDFVYVAGDKHICSFTSRSLEALLALAGIELVTHSEAPGWHDNGLVAADRLACIGRRVSGQLDAPADPLEPAIEALLAYGATRPEPQPRPKPSLLRRVVRRARRRLRKRS